MPASPPPPPPARPYIGPAPFQIRDEDADLDEDGRLIVGIRREGTVVAAYAVPTGRTLVLARLAMAVHQETSRASGDDADARMSWVHAPPTPTTTPPDVRARISTPEPSLRPYVVSIVETPTDRDASAARTLALLFLGAVVVMMALTLGVGAYLRHAGRTIHLTIEEGTR
jgi:hypothetical protein